MSRRPGWIEDAERLDLAIYAAIARTPTPALDDAMSRLSHAADYSRLWLASAGLLALAGGRTGRRAAADGLVSVAVTSGVVNVAVKPLARRRRPDRLAGRSRSRGTCGCRPRARFPPGIPRAPSRSRPASVMCRRRSRPLRGLAAAVAYSRVHTGVHYPGDVWPVP